MITNLHLLMYSDQRLMGLECLLSGAVRLVFCVHHLHIMYVILAANDANRAASARWSAEWDVHLWCCPFWVRVFCTLNVFVWERASKWESVLWGWFLCSGWLASFFWELLWAHSILASTRDGQFKAFLINYRSVCDWFKTFDKLGVSYYLYQLF